MDKDKPLMIKTSFSQAVTEEILTVLKPVYDELENATPDANGKCGAIIIEMDNSGFVNAIYIPQAIATELHRHTYPIYKMATVIDHKED